MLPDGVRGCCLPSYYHGTGSYYTDAEDGRDAGAGRRARLDETKSKDEAALARLKGWDELAIGEVDADYAMYRGHRVLGSSFPYVRFKPKIARARAEACAAYAAAADEVAEAEPEAWAALTSDARYASTGRRKGAEGTVQTVDDGASGAERALRALYDGALGAPARSSSSRARRRGRRVARRRRRGRGRVERQTGRQRAAQGARGGRVSRT